MPLQPQSGKSAQRRAYLVSLWRTDSHQPWRASVKRVSDGQEFHFASAEKLFLFLHEQTTADTEGDLSSWQD